MAAASMLGYSLIVSAPSSASAKGVGKILGKPEKTFGGRFVNDAAGFAQNRLVECGEVQVGVNIGKEDEQSRTHKLGVFKLREIGVGK